MMSKTSKWLLVTGILGSTALTLAGCGAASSATTQVPPNAQKVQVTASNFKWTLDKRTVKVGKPVDFIVSAAESAHGFSIAGTNISQTVEQGQAPVQVVWTPTKVGQYTIACDQFCGSGHAQMFTTITVTS